MKRMKRMKRRTSRRSAARDLCGMIAVAVVAAATLISGGAGAQETPSQPTPPPAVGSSVDQRVYLDADAFRALFEGKTLHLSADGLHYGSEYYQEGDKAIWIAAGQPCRSGYWYYRQDQICFQYEDDGPFCWRIFKSQDDFFAESTDGFQLRIYAIEDKPLSCQSELLS